MKKLKLFSPAKINLTLDVVGRREDGYHDLETVMQTIDLGDTLTFELAKSDVLSCSERTTPCDPTNFVWQAIQLFRQKSGQKFSVRIHIEKRIPQQRGLGGGSSNVATTLWALNQLTQAAIEERELQSWSQEISSDAPFFFSKGSAFCTSKGECVQELPLPAQKTFRLINPRYGLSTKHVFAELDNKKLKTLEEAAFSLEPRLQALKVALQKRFHTVFMTGSGSALICEGDGKEGLPIRFIQRGNSWY